MANSFANYNATKDATLAYDTYGNGQCPDLFAGSEADSIIDRRALVYCPVAKPAGFVSLVNAWFYIRCRTGSVTGHDTPTTTNTDFALRKLSSSWSEGTAGSSTDHGYYSSNAVVWPGPGYSGSKTMTFVDGSWISVLITDWVSAFFNGTDTNYGFRLEATSGLPNLVFYSRESGSEPYIRIEYTTNTAPTAPTITSPTGGAIVASQTPDLKFKPQDPQADNHSKYQYQVDSDIAFGSPDDDYTITGTFTNNTEITRTVVATLTRGTTYYWRVKTWDAAGLEGAWSAAQQFKIGRVPTRTVQQPSGADSLIKTQFTPGVGQTGPRLVVEWTPTCADGGSQDYYRVEVYNDNVGSPGTTFENTGDVYSTAASWTSSNYPVEGNKYHVRVYTRCSHGIWSTDASYIRCRARWGYTVQKGTLSGAPTSWSVTPTTTNGNGAIVLEYGSSSNSGDTTPASGWKSNIGSVPLNQYFFYRAWGLIWGAGSGLTSPALTKLVLSYMSTSLTPDKWTKKIGSSTLEAIDTGNFVYGTQSAKITGDSTQYPGYKQNISVVENTDYVISWRWMGSAVKASVEVWSENRAQFIAWVQKGSATWAWEPGSFAFNSGNRTVVEVSINVDNTTSGTLWVDAMKVEASTVVTPWTPSFLGTALVLDAGGIQIDASQYGIFRLRGGSGGTRDRVDLGSKGLVFGGDAELYSDTSNILRTGTNDSFQVGSELRLGTNAHRIADGGTAKLSLLTSAGGALMAQAKSLKISTAYADPDPNDAGIQFGADTNLYRSAANILKTDDTLWVAGHSKVEYSATPSNLTCTVASTNYAWATAEVSFTPAYVGQPWLIMLHIPYLYWGASGAATITANIVDSSNATISGMFTIRHEDAAGVYRPFHATGVWIADAVATRKVKVYGAHTTAGTVITAASAFRITGYPLP